MNPDPFTKQGKALPCEVCEMIVEKWLERSSDFVTNSILVSPGTHLVSSHKSLSITSESQLKKTKSPELKMLGMGLLTRRLIWRQTPKLFITVY